MNKQDITYAELVTPGMIDEARKRLADAQVNARDLLQRRAEQQCPFKLGEKVTIAGYTFTGKQGIVVRIMTPRYNDYGDWAVAVTVCKGDGSPGIKTTSFSQRDWEKANPPKGEPES